MKTPHQKLCACLERITHGPWRFIQLRGMPLSPYALDGGDTDLFGTRASVMALLDAVFTWVQQGDCHARLNVRSADKYKLFLYSRDGKHHLDLDLWVNLRQLFGRSTLLLLEPLWPMSTMQTPAIYRLPVEFEVALYIQHLIAKKRFPLRSTAIERLQNYRNLLPSTVWDTALATALESNTITPELLTLSDNLFKRYANVTHGDKRHHPWRRLRHQLLSAPRRPSWFALIGGDGSGKTALADTLTGQYPNRYHRSYIAKHLYRKTITYKILSNLLRPLLWQPRENFDDSIAPLAYLLACTRLRWALWRTPRGQHVLMGRAPVDFLMCQRKTDQPGFGRREWMTRFWGCRIPTIHLILGYDTLAQRKVEMSLTGLQSYNQAMFQHFSRRCPTDYLLFNNEGTLDNSAQALDSILVRGFFSHQKQPKPHHQKTKPDKTNVL